MKAVKPVSRKQAMKNATASVRMEGFRITPKMQSYGQQVLEGKITMRQAVEQMNREKSTAPKETSYAKSIEK